MVAGLGLGARDVAAVAHGGAAVGVRPTVSGGVAPPERGDAGAAQHPKGVAEVCQETVAQDQDRKRYPTSSFNLKNFVHIFIFTLNSEVKRTILYVTTPETDIECSATENLLASTVKNVTDYTCNCYCY